MPLTWREVTGPNFNGVAESQRLGATLLSNGFQSAIDAISGFGKDQADRERNALLNEGTRLDNVNQGLVNDQLGWGNGKLREFEAGRAAAVDLANQIRSFAQLGTEEGRRKADELMRGGSQIWANSGMTVNDIGALVNGNLGTTNSGLATNQALQTAGDFNADRAENIEAEKLLTNFIKTAATPEELDKALRNSGASPDVISKALTLSGNQAPGLFGPNVDPNMVALEESIQGGPGRVPGGLAPIQGLIDRTEGAADYDTLFNHAQKGSGPLAGIQVSKQTIGQLKQFSSGDGAYGQHQRSIGSEGTPMGRYQIVGRTLANAAREMGLSDDTVFTPEVQDAIFQHLVDGRLSGPRTMEGKIEGLRQEWAGFKGVPDNVLAQAITAYENGDKNALLAGAQQNRPAESPIADPVTAALQAAAQANQAASALPGVGGSQSLLDRDSLLGGQAQSILDTYTADGMFGNPALIAKLTNPGSDRSEIDIAKELIDKMAPQEGEERQALLSNPNNIIGEINKIQDKYGLSAEMAAAFLGEAIDQRWFGSRWLLEQTAIDQNKLDSLISQYYNKDGKTSQEKLKPALEQLAARNNRAGTTQELTRLQSTLAKAQQDYFNAKERAKTNPGVKADAALRRYEAVQRELERAIAKANANPLLTFNTNGER